MPADVEKAIKNELRLNQAEEALKDLKQKSEKQEAAVNQGLVKLEKELVRHSDIFENFITKSWPELVVNTTSLHTKIDGFVTNNIERQHKSALADKEQELKHTALEGRVGALEKERTEQRKLNLKLVTTGGGAGAAVAALVQLLMSAMKGG